MDANMNAQPANIETRGRPVMKKTEQVLDLLKTQPTMTVEQIAEMANTSKQYVYEVRYRYITKGTKPQRKLRAPRKMAQSVETKIVPVVKPFNVPFAEFDAMRREIADLKAVIRYLEEKISHGASV